MEGATDEMYWIQDDDEDGLMWSPGRVVSVHPDKFIVECIVQGDQYEIDRDDPMVVHPSCLGKYHSRMSAHNQRIYIEYYNCYVCLILLFLFRRSERLALAG